MSVCLDEIQVVNIPLWASGNFINVSNAILVREIAWVCRFCGSSVAYSHHRVCSNGKKLSRKTSIKDKRSVAIYS